MRHGKNENPAACVSCSLLLANKKKKKRRSEIQILFVSELYVPSSQNYVYILFLWLNVG